MMALHVSGVARLAVEGWEWRPAIALPLLILSAAYALGYRRLARRAAAAVRSWHAVAWGVAMLALVVALLSPLSGLAHELFSAHMVQHMLLIVVAAPLVLVARPFPALLWALPARARAPSARVLAPGRPLRLALAAALAAPVAWLAHAVVLWLWHLPVAYDAALTSPLLHDTEHVAFFVTAILFWWPVVEPSPRLRPPPAYGARTAYLVLAAFQSSLLGLLLTLSPWALYQSYASSAPARGWSPVADQAGGGLVMWGLGGLVDMLAVLILVYRYLAAQDRPSPRPKPNIVLPA